MNDVCKTLILPLNINKEQFKVQLIYHNTYRQLRNARLKHRLSGNTLLVLNGVYLYSMLIKTEFTFTSIRNFVKYYNKGRIEYYLGVLIDRGYIHTHRQANKRLYYRLTESGYNLISEMFNEYDYIHSKFINQFNISL